MSVPGLNLSILSLVSKPIKASEENDLGSSSRKQAGRLISSSSREENHKPGLERVKVMAEDTAAGYSLNDRL